MRAAPPCPEGQVQLVGCHMLLHAPNALEAPLHAPSQLLPPHCPAVAEGLGAARSARVQAKLPDKKLLPVHCAHPVRPSQLIAERAKWSKSMDLQAYKWLATHLKGLIKVPNVIHKGVWGVVSCVSAQSFISSELCLAG
eukprot:1142289-Pelagomonas_calceolata.AAC.3